MSRPLVLLHGFTGSPDSWAEVVQRLRRTGGSQEILAPALLGHDGTAGPPGIDTFEDEVDRIATDIRARGLPPAHLAGYSLGGRIAIGLLVRHPELFAAATLVGANPGLSGEAERRERAEWDERWAQLLETEGLDTFVRAWSDLPLFRSQAALPDERLAAQDRIRRSHDPYGLARSLRTTGLSRMPDYRPRLGEIRIPVRIVVGERDDKFRALSDPMAARLPAAEITIVPDAGHNVVLERPEAVVRVLSRGGGPRFTFS